MNRLTEPDPAAVAPDLEPLSIRSLWSQYWQVPVIGLLAGMLAFFGSFLVSSTYSSSTNLLVRSRDTTLLSSKGIALGEQGGTVIDSSLATALADTQAALVSSNDVAEQVVRQLGLDKPAPKPTGVIAKLRTGASSTYKHIKAFLFFGGYKKASNFDMAVGLVQNSVSASQVKTGYVLQITATADDPKLAALIADATADVLVREGNARFEGDSTKYRELLAARVDDAAKARSDAALAVSAFKEKHNISDLDTQVRLDATATSTLKARVVDLRAQIDGTQAQLAELQSAIAKTQRSATSSQQITTGRSTTSIDSTTSNPSYTSLVSQRDQVNAMLAAEQAQLAALDEALRGPSASSAPLTKDEAELSRLQLQLSLASTNYAALSNSYQQAQLNAAGASVELSRVDKAIIPTYPSGPMRYLYLAVGLVLGLSIGFIVSQWRVLKRRRALAILAAEGPDLAPGTVVPGVGQGAGHVSFRPADPVDHGLGVMDGGHAGPAHDPAHPSVTVPVNAGLPVGNGNGYGNGHASAEHVVDLTSQEPPAPRSPRGARRAADSTNPPGQPGGAGGLGAYGYPEREPSGDE